MHHNRPKKIVELREIERDLFFDGVWSNGGTMIAVKADGWIDFISANVQKGKRQAVAVQAA